MVRTVVSIEEEHDLSLALRILDQLSQLIRMSWSKRAVVRELQSFPKDSVDRIPELRERDGEQHHVDTLGGEEGVVSKCSVTEL